MGGSDRRTVVFCTLDMCYSEVELGAVIVFLHISLYNHIIHMSHNWLLKL